MLGIGKPDGNQAKHPEAAAALRALLAPAQPNGLRYWRRGGM